MVSLVMVLILVGEDDSLGWKGFEALKLQALIIEHPFHEAFCVRLCVLGV